MTPVNDFLVNESKDVEEEDISAFPFQSDNLPSFVYLLYFISC